MPEHDAVLAVNSGAKDMGAIMQQAWDHLRPGFHNEPLRESESGIQALKTRLDSLVLDMPQGRPRQLSAKAANGKTYTIEMNDLGIESTQFEFGDEVALSWKDQSGLHRIPVGKDEWLRQRVPSIGKLIERLPPFDDVAIATTGAWTDSDTYHVRIWLYESPYRVDIAVRFSGDDVFLDVTRNVGFGAKKFELKGVSE